MSALHEMTQAQMNETNASRLVSGRHVLLRQAAIHWRKASEFTTIPEHKATFLRHAESCERRADHLESREKFEEAANGRTNS